MKVEDLVILSFPLSGEAKDEVRACGEALFFKHARKHVMQEDLSREVVIGRLAGEERPWARRAWLIEFPVDPNLEKAETALVEGENYRMVHKTHPFPAGAFNNNTGVYLVCHHEHGITQIFNYFEMGLAHRFPDVGLDRRYELAYERGAAGLVSLIVKLGINRMEKLCMVACSMATEGYQKGFLPEVLTGLAARGLRPKVAGWDIPITVQEDGHKRAAGQGRAGPLKDERKKHKFVYTYVQGHQLQFTAPTAGLDDKLAAKVSEELKTFAVKGADVPKAHAAKFENVIMNRNVAHGPIDGKKGKSQVTVAFDYVQRMRYAGSGWSSQ